MSRTHNIIRLSVASIALAGLAGCYYQTPPQYPNYYYPNQQYYYGGYPYAAYPYGYAQPQPAPQPAPPPPQQPQPQPHVAPPPPPPQPPAPDCRQYQKSVIISGQPQDAFGIVCRQPDGTWKDENSGAHVPPPQPSAPMPIVNAAPLPPPSAPVPPPGASAPHADELPAPGAPMAPTEGQ